MTSEPGTLPLATSASPEQWTWSLHDASRPRRATEHVGQSEVGAVAIDILRAKDALPGSGRRLARDIPIIVVDTGDAYWAFEKVLNKLHSFGNTAEDAKAELFAKLVGHLRLLSSLESPAMAPILRLELEYLRIALQPVSAAGPEG